MNILVIGKFYTEGFALQIEKWLGVMERHPGVGFVFNAYGVEGSD